MHPGPIRPPRAAITAVKAELGVAAVRLPDGRVL
jgi:hypothetical protein